MASPVPWRTFLPTEHGSWGFVLEPLVLGALAARTAPALAGAGAFLLLFLAYRPAALGAGDVLRGKRYARTFAGLALGALFGIAAAALLGLVWAPSVGGDPWPAAAVYGLSLAVYAVAAEIRAHRDLPRKLSGAVGAAPTATLVALAGPDVPAEVAYLFAAFMLLRALPSILYVRERLDMARGKPPRRAWVLAAHVAAFGVAAAIVFAAKLGPWAAVAFAFLAVRSWIGLSARNNPVKPGAVGVREIAWGAVTVLSAAASVWTAANGNGP